MPSSTLHRSVGALAYIMIFHRPSLVPGLETEVEQMQALINMYGWNDLYPILERDKKKLSDDR
jgi:hypothetical protein